MLRQSVLLFRYCGTYLVLCCRILVKCSIFFVQVQTICMRTRISSGLVAFLVPQSAQVLGTRALQQSLGAAEVACTCAPHTTAASFAQSCIFCAAGILSASKIENCSLSHRPGRRGAKQLVRFGQCNTLTAQGPQAKERRRRQLARRWWARWPWGDTLEDEDEETRCCASRC